MSKAKKPTASSTTDGKIAELDQKWLDKFNHLEALLMAKSFQPTFSSDVRVTPSHSPPANVGKDTEPFFEPTSSVASHQPLSDRSLHRSPSTECTGPGSPAIKHRRPASSSQTDLYMDLQSALAQAFML